MARTRRAFLTGLATVATAAIPPAWRARRPAQRRPGPAASGGGWPRSLAERRALGLPDPSKISSRRLLNRDPGCGGPPAGTPRRAGGRNRAAIDRPSRGQGVAAARFPDLRRRFVFEYYPWYDTNPWFHWNDADRRRRWTSRRPRCRDWPVRHLRLAGTRAARALDRRGGCRRDQPELVGTRRLHRPGGAAGDGRDARPRHQGHVPSRAVPRRRSRNYAEDLLFLLREYGEKRRWDTFLLLEDGSGGVAPVFKSFRTILPSQVQVCLGRIFDVPDYTADGDWRRQTDAAREETRRDFSRLFLLADSLAVDRIAAAVRRAGGLRQLRHAVAMDADRRRMRATSGCSRRSTSTPASIAIRTGSHRPHPTSTRVTAAHWDSNRAARTRTGMTCRRVRGAGLALNRITESFTATTTLQQQTGSANARRGFFLAYVNSFNEWHEGSQFEPAKDFNRLTPGERRIGYHNPPDGLARLRRLRSLIDGLAAPDAE